MLRHNSEVASYISFLKHPLQLVSNLFETPPPPLLPAPAGAIATNPFVTNTMTNTMTAGSSVAAEAAKAAATQIQGPPGICGYIPSETGSPDWVCQTMGQMMPGVVFFVSLTVILLTMIFLLRYFFRCWRASSELRLLLNALNDQKSLAPHEVARPEHVTQVLAALHTSGNRFPALAPLGRKIEDSLIRVDENSKGQLLSKSVPEIAEKNLSLFEWTGQKLADEIPNWLTATGLLTTFIAILLGLQHVKVLTNLEVQGIGGLVNGLSGKFFSSIVALGCALIVTVANYFLSAKISRLWEEILLKLEGLLPYLNTEQMLFDLLKDRQRKKMEP